MNSVAGGLRTRWPIEPAVRKGLNLASSVSTPGFCIVETFATVQRWKQILRRFEAMLHAMSDYPTATPGLVPEVASTGIAELDHALGGLFWGDNVVFEVTDPPGAQPFYRAVAAVEDRYDQRLYVTLSHEPTEVRGFDVIHAGPGSELAQPAPVLRAIVDRCRRSERNLVLFEAMQTMIERWGADVTVQFFAHCCPQLLDLGAIAYWSVPSGHLYPGLRRTIEEITQCVLVVGDSRLRIAKAEGRLPRPPPTAADRASACHTQRHRDGCCRPRPRAGHPRQWSSGAAARRGAADRRDDA